MKTLTVDAITIASPLPVAIPSFNMHTPFSSLALYKNVNTSIQQEEKGMSIAYSEFQYTQRFQKLKQRDVSPVTPRLYLCTDIGTY